jgi:hypothetical protein
MSEPASPPSEHLSEGDVIVDTSHDLADQVISSEEECMPEIEIPIRPLHYSRKSSSALANLPIKKRPPSRKDQPPPPSDEMEAALDLLFHGVPPEDFDPTILKFCIERLTALKVDAIQERNYLEADLLCTVDQTISEGG